MMTADLHVHTVASDGLFTAQEVCQMAFRQGLSGIAITDHDTLQGVMSIETSDYRPQIDVLPGVEISTEWRGEEVHILGYNFTRNKEHLEKILSSFQEDRKRRIKKMVQKLVSLGYYITVEQVENSAKGESLGRPHVARALIAAGYFSSPKDAFERLLEKGKPGYVHREKTTPREGIEAIISSGGVPVLAHPGLIKNGSDLIPELVSAGLKGIEVYYPLHSRNLVNWLLRITEKYGLLATGGSDFHGIEGDRLGKSCVDYSVIEAIRNTTP